MRAVDAKKDSVRQVFVHLNRNLVEGEVGLECSGLGASIRRHQHRLGIATVALHQLENFAAHRRVRVEAVDDFTAHFLGIVNPALENIRRESADRGHDGGAEEGVRRRRAVDAVNCGQVSSAVHDSQDTDRLDVVRAFVGATRGDAEGDCCVVVPRRGRNRHLSSAVNASDGNERIDCGGRSSEVVDSDDHTRLQEASTVRRTSNSTRRVNNQRRCTGARPVSQRKNPAARPCEHTIALTSEVVNQSFLFRLHGAGERARVGARRLHHRSSQLNAPIEEAHRNAEFCVPLTTSGGQKPLFGGGLSTDVTRRAEWHDSHPTLPLKLLDVSLSEVAQETSLGVEL